jgi:hypothetical protein
MMVLRALVVLLLAAIALLVIALSTKSAPVPVRETELALERPMNDLPGYRQPSAATVQLVSRIKHEEERILRFIEELDDVDGRWRSIAITHLQEGAMALVRAILKPGRIDLPEDGSIPLGASMAAPLGQGEILADTTVNPRDF